MKVGQTSDFDSTWLYQPVFAWMLFVIWFLGSSAFSEKASQLHGLAWRLPRVNLALRDLDAERAGLLFEVSIRANDANSPPRISHPSSAPFLAVSLPEAADGDEPWRWLNVRVAASDAQGCIRYGGENIVVTPRDADWEHAPPIEVTMRQLPAAFCM